MGEYVCQSCACVVMDRIDDFGYFADLVMEQVGKEGKILDAGGGTGHNSLFLASRGFLILYNDASYEMHKIAEETLKECENVIILPREDMTNLELAEHSLDGIVASFSLINMVDEDIMYALAKFNRFLKIGGIIYVAMQSESSQQSELSPMQPNLKPTIHPRYNKEEIVNVYSEFKTRQTMSRSGFLEVLLDESRPAKEEEKELPYDKHFYIARKTIELKLYENV